VSAILRGSGSRGRRSRVRVWPAWRRGRQSAHRGSPAVRGAHSGNRHPARDDGPRRAARLRVLCLASCPCRAVVPRRRGSVRLHDRGHGVRRCHRRPVHRRTRADRTTPDDHRFGGLRGGHRCLRLRAIPRPRLRRAAVRGLGERLLHRDRQLHHPAQRRAEQARTGDRALAGRLPGSPCQ